MSCIKIPVPGGVAVVCTGGGGRRLKCQVRGCTRGVVALCDHVLDPYARGTKRRTCDARLCDEHRVRVGANRDLCPFHGEGAQPRQCELFPQGGR